MLGLLYGWKYLEIIVCYKLLFRIYWNIYDSIDRKNTYDSDFI